MFMKKIDIHISKGFIKAFMLSLLAFVNIFVLSQAFRVLKLIGDGKMDGMTGILYMMAMVPRILIDVTPLSILLGGLFSMNVMASNLEIISLKTSGISFKRIILFPTIISLVVSGGVFYLSDKVAPKYFDKTKELRGSKGDRTIPIVKNRAFLRGSGDFIYYMANINRENGIGTSIQLVDLNPEFNRIERVITAEKGRYNREKKIWELQNANIYSYESDKSQTVKEFSEIKYSASPESFITVEKDPRTLTNAEIKKDLKEIKAVGGNTKEYIQELANRYSFPFASFIISFIGLALGSRYVRGASAISIGISIILGYGYYLLGGVFEAFSKNGYLNPFIGNWIPNILFILLGIYFVNRAEY